MRPNRRADGVNLLQGSLDRHRASHIARHPDRKEDCVKTTLAHARNVDRAIVIARTDIEAFVKNEALRGVIVRVDDDGPVVELPGASRNLRLAHKRDRTKEDDEECRHP